MPISSVKIGNIYFNYFVIILHLGANCNSPKQEQVKIGEKYILHQLVQKHIIKITILSNIEHQQPSQCIDNLPLKELINAN